MGVEDSVAWHAEQTIESGGGRNDPDVVRRFAEEALPTIHWLEGMGIRFLPETQTTWGAEWPRGHKPFLPRGSSYIRTLSGKFLELGGEIRTKTALRDLLKDERGRITGVVTTEGVEIRAKCVVLASGGYGANPNLLRRWAPDWAELPTDNAPGSTGDGQLAAERAGAALVNLDVVQAVPGVRKGQNHAVRLDLDVGACILVDARGGRLVEEDGSRRALALSIRNAGGGRAYTVTDDRGVSSLKACRRGTPFGRRRSKRSPARRAFPRGRYAAPSKPSTAKWRRESESVAASSAAKSRRLPSGRRPSTSTFTRRSGAFASRPRARCSTARERFCRASLPPAKSSETCTGRTASAETGSPRRSPTGVSRGVRPPVRLFSAEDFCAARGRKRGAALEHEILNLSRGARGWAERLPGGKMASSDGGSDRMNPVLRLFERK